MTYEQHKIMVSWSRICFCIKICKRSFHLGCQSSTELHKFGNKYLQTENYASGITSSMKRFLILKMVLCQELLQQCLVFGHCLPSLSFNTSARACLSLSFCIHCLWKKEARPVDKKGKDSFVGTIYLLSEGSFGHPSNL